MSKVLAAALEQAVEDALNVEDVAIEALREAASWRQVALMALTVAAEAQAEAQRWERRMRAAELTLHQVMGTKPWHEEQSS